MNQELHFTIPEYTVLSRKPLPNELDNWNQSNYSQIRTKSKPGVQSCSWLQWMPLLSMTSLSSDRRFKAQFLQTRFGIADGPGHGRGRCRKGFKPALHHMPLRNSQKRVHLSWLVIALGSQNTHAIQLRKQLHKDRLSGISLDLSTI